MTRIGAYLAAAVRSLRTMQLPTGELSSVRVGDDGDTYYAPAPLLSALAYDALAWVDPRSTRFVGRVRDLAPQPFFVDVVSLRWGLRLYLASEQSADGTWQLHGRLGARGACIATTACAAIALLPNTRWRKPRADPRPLAALQRLRVTSNLDAAHAARYCTLAGVDATPFLEHIEGPLSIEEAHALGTMSTIDAAPPKNTLADALRTATLLDLGNDALDVHALIDDKTPPSQWPADAYADRRIASPAAALAIRIGNVARMATLPHGEHAA